MATALNSPTLMSLFTTVVLPDLPGELLFSDNTGSLHCKKIVLKSLFFNIGNHLKCVILLTSDADVDFGIGFELLHCVLYLRILCAGF